MGRKSNSNGSTLLLLLLLLPLGSVLVTYKVYMQMVKQQLLDAVSSRSRAARPLVQTPEDLTKRFFHVAVTSDDIIYSQWQCRIMYHWYRKVKDGQGSEMGGFTRILHSGMPDDLMGEIPTFVVEPLPPDLQQGYVVLNRPWAFVQWLKKATIEEDYILMAEPDHIFVKPLPNLARGSYPAAFPFSYIEPSKHERIISKFYPVEKGPVADLDPIGNSPVIIQKSQLEKIAPTWTNISIKMKADPEASSAFGWVLEMYAYSVSSGLHGLRHSLHKDFMIQPPRDLTVGTTYVIHYTYPSDYTSKGELTSRNLGQWHFNKRSYMYFPPPRNITLPPPGAPESVVTLIKMINQATANLPWWKAQV